MTSLCSFVVLAFKGLDALILVVEVVVVVVDVGPG